VPDGGFCFNRWHLKTEHEGECLLDLIYTAFGYLIFTWFENLSLVDGPSETA
jgi:hypothetical protein